VTFWDTGETLTDSQTGHMRTGITGPPFQGIDNAGAPHKTLGLISVSYY